MTATLRPEPACVAGGPAAPSPDRSRILCRARSLATRAIAGEASDPFEVVRADRRLCLLAGGWLMATTLALVVG